MEYADQSIAIARGGYRMNKHISCRSPLSISNAPIPVPGELSSDDAQWWKFLINPGQATVSNFAELITTTTQNPYLFHHRPLDYSRPCIRLLNILPRADFRAPICCEIRNVSLSPGDPALDFTAVSYAWGAENSPEYDILIDGKSYSVRKNLYDFFCQHGASGISNLWVDSICINQRDTREKNHQVKLMKDIFSQAAKVLVWLGPSNRHIDDFFNMLHRLHAREARSLSGHPATVDEVSQAWSTIWNRDAAILAATKDLCRRAYWTRAWVVQEILLARDIELLCGVGRLSWAAWIYHVNNIAGSMLQSRLLAGRLEDPFQFLRDSSMMLICDQWIAGRRENKPRNLTSLVLHFAGQQCLRKHDKVYSLIGLASDADHFPVNYEMPIEGLCLALLGNDSGHRSIQEVAKLCEACGISSTRLVLVIDVTTSSMGASRCRKNGIPQLSTTSSQKIDRTLTECWKQLGRHPGMDVEMNDVGLYLAPEPGDALGKLYRNELTAQTHPERWFEASDRIASDLVEEPCFCAVCRERDVHVMRLGAPVAFRKRLGTNLDMKTYSQPLETQVTSFPFHLESLEMARQGQPSLRDEMTVYPDLSNALQNVRTATAPAVHLMRQMQNLVLREGVFSSSGYTRRNNSASDDSEFKLTYSVSIGCISSVDKHPARPLQAVQCCRSRVYCISPL